MECSDVSACCIHSTRLWHSKEVQSPSEQSSAAAPLRTGLGFPSCSGREWQFDSERRAPADLRSKVYRTIQKLHNSKRACEPDSAASRASSEKQLENFLTIFQWNSFAGVAHRNLRCFATAAKHQPQLPAGRHGLRCIPPQI